MVEQSDLGQSKINPPSKQLLVDWVLEANQMLDSNLAIVKKSFLVTGLSNALGGEENHLIRDDSVRKEIEEHLDEVFGISMGYVPPLEDESDPFCTSDEDSASSSHSDSDSECEDEELEDLSASSSIVGPDYEPLDSDSSIVGPDFEPLDSPPSC